MTSPIQSVDDPGAEIPSLVRRRAMVPMRDAVNLATDLVLPADGAPRPALVVRTAYGLPNGEDILRAFVHNEGSEALLRQGWAVVIQSCRGRYESEGTFD